MEDIVIVAAARTPVGSFAGALGGLSAHADQAGLLEWYGHFGTRPPVYLVRGEDPAREVLAGLLRERFGAKATLTAPGMEVAV